MPEIKQLIGLQDSFIIPQNRIENIDGSGKLIQMGFGSDPADGFVGVKST
jgi:hypothetical protein